MKKFLTGAAILLGAAAAWAAPANAALVSCPAAYTADGTAKVFNGNQTAASACQYITPPDNSYVANIANINATAFFGFGNWADNGQTQLGGAGNTGLSGTWSIANVDFAAYDYLIAFKSGNGTNLVAFLFNEEYASGGWSTPFTSTIFDINNSKDVSHLTIARRANRQVPEPAMLGLLGLGLAGVAMARRRKA